MDPDSQRRLTRLLSGGRRPLPLKSGGVFPSRDSMDCSRDAGFAVLDGTTGVCGVAFILVRKPYSSCAIGEGRLQRVAAAFGATAK